MTTKSSFTLIASLLILMFSCGDPGVEFQDISYEEWEKEDQVKFMLANTNSPTLYLRHTNDYHFQNLWLKVSYTPKDSLPDFKRHEFQIAQPDGRWIGKKKGAIYSLNLPLNGLNCDADSCQLILEQNMRENPLNGILAVGVGE